jgi:hypothetical protein
VRQHTERIGAQANHLEQTIALLKSIGGSNWRYADDRAKKRAEPKDCPAYTGNYEKPERRGSGQRNGEDSGGRKRQEERRDEVGKKNEW